MHLRKIYALICIGSFLLLLFACNTKKAVPKEKEIVADPRSMDSYVHENIETLLDAAEEGAVIDSVRLSVLPAIEKYYASRDYMPVWSSSQEWKPQADSMVNFLSHAEGRGLFPNDYHFNLLYQLVHRLASDSAKKKDAVLWAKAEIFLTDAFFRLLQDTKLGRLQPDSVVQKWREDKYEPFFASYLDRFAGGSAISLVIDSLEPAHTNYQLLKEATRNFVDSMDRKEYTYLNYPYKDSIRFVQLLVTRLGESGLLSTETFVPDSVKLARLITVYQRKHNLKADGKPGVQLVRSLNNTDREKFKRIAITLDRYKALPAVMPGKYIWVNIPAYNLKVIDADTVVLESRVIIGKPITQTPLITSAITDLIIYPTWTVPTSIITKEMLPALKKNSGYLAKKGLNLLNSKGELVDPDSVNWAKYSKGIPFRIQQGSGDDNALGVIKFNFSNPYSVYLHDTNQRYLFKNSMRSLSHGCVRVQEWQKLAFYIIRNDSMLSKNPAELDVNTDSITTWIARQEKHRVAVKNRFPLFIRYFGCEPVDGTIRFFDDIYGHDKLMSEKYFRRK